MPPGAGRSSRLHSRCGRPPGRRRGRARGRSRSRRAPPGGSAPERARECPTSRAGAPRRDPEPRGARGAWPRDRRAAGRASGRWPGLAEEAAECPARCRTRRTRTPRGPAGRRPAPAIRSSAASDSRARAVGSSASRRARISRRSAALADGRPRIELRTGVSHARKGTPPSRAVPSGAGGPLSACFRDTDHTRPARGVPSSPNSAAPASALPPLATERPAREQGSPTRTLEDRCAASRREASVIPPAARLRPLLGQARPPRGTCRPDVAAVVGEGSVPERRGCRRRPDGPPDPASRRPSPGARAGPKASNPGTHDPGSPGTRARPAPLHRS